MFTPSLPLDIRTNSDSLYQHLSQTETEDSEATEVPSRQAMASAPLNLSSFLDTASTSTTTSGGQRPAPAPMAQQQQPVNGNGNGMNGVPMYAGQQMDVNLIYATVVELSNVLNENREKTQGIINGAEELAVSNLISLIASLELSLEKGNSNLIRTIRVD